MVNSQEEQMVRDPPVGNDASPEPTEKTQIRGKAMTFEHRTITRSISSDGSLSDGSRSDDNSIPTTATDASKRQGSFYTAVDATRALQLSLVVSAIVFAALELLNAKFKNDNVWGYCQTGFPEPLRWCEAGGAELAHFMVEPANARSNYGYFILGVYLVTWGCLQRQKVLALERIAADSGKESPQQPKSIDTRRRRSEQSATTNATISEIFSDTIGSTRSGAIIAAEAGARDTPATETAAAAAAAATDVASEADESSMDPLEYLEQMNAYHRFPLLTITSGLSLMVLGFGSWWFHASECPSANQWDAIGMFGISVSPALFCLASLIPNPRRFLFVVPLTHASLIAMELLVDLGDLIWVGALLGISFVLIIVMVVVHRGAYTYDFRALGATLFTLAVSFSIWILDVSDNICGSGFGGHPFWHLGTCLAIAFIFLFLKSERPVTKASINNCSDGCDDIGIGGGDSNADRVADTIIDLEANVAPSMADTRHTLVESGTSPSHVAVAAPAAELRAKSVGAPQGCDMEHGAD